MGRCFAKLQAFSYSTKPMKACSAPVDAYAAIILIGSELFGVAPYDHLR
jgi:hypothetical protein